MSRPHFLNVLPASAKAIGSPALRIELTAGRTPQEIELESGLQCGWPAGHICNRLGYYHASTE